MKEHTRTVHEVYVQIDKPYKRTTLGYVHDAKDNKDALRQYRSATNTLPKHLYSKKVQITGVYDIKNSKII